LPEDLREISHRIAALDGVYDLRRQRSR
jgi:hypothetical protein